MGCSCNDWTQGPVYYCCVLWEQGTLAGSSLHAPSSVTTSPPVSVALEMKDDYQVLKWQHDGV